MPALRNLAIISTLFVLGPVLVNVNTRTDSGDDAGATIISLRTMFDVQL